MENRSDKSVSVVIVTCGVRNYLSECLKSLQSQSHGCPETIVIDNSLNPAFSQRIKEEFPWVKIYPSQNDLYYCLSLNKGIGLTSTAFVLCLNDDVVLDKDFIQQALKGFFDESIGMVSAKILRRDGKTLDSTGLFLSPCRTPKERGYAKPDSGQFEKGGFVFGVSGCVAFYRRKMLDVLKEGDEYFDTDLRMFYEDLDISWRANKNGWKAYYVPQAIAYHARGGSFRPESGLDKPIARRYLDDQAYNDLMKNRYIVMLKNENLPRLILYLIPIMLYELCLWGYTLFFRPQAIKMFIRNRGYFSRAVKKTRKRRSA